MFGLNGGVNFKAGSYIIDWKRWLSCQSGWKVSELTTTAMAMVNKKREQADESMMMSERKTVVWSYICCFSSIIRSCLSLSKPIFLIQANCCDTDGTHYFNDLVALKENESICFSIKIGIQCRTIQWNIYDAKSKTWLNIIFHDVQPAVR